MRELCGAVGAFIVRGLGHCSLTQCCFTQCCPADHRAARLKTLPSGPLLLYAQVDAPVFLHNLSGTFPTCIGSIGLEAEPMCKALKISSCLPWKRDVLFGNMQSCVMQPLYGRQFLTQDTVILFRLFWKQKAVTLVQSQCCTNLSNVKEREVLHQ